LAGKANPGFLFDWSKHDVQATRARGKPRAHRVLPLAIPVSGLHPAQGGVVAVRTILWALIAAPILYVVLWLLMTMF
jgi:hypothetical protein